jgi:hypothetical protein
MAKRAPQAAPLLLMKRTHSASGLFTSAGSSLRGLSLSSYFPAGTHYFYAYPTGDDSGFLNNVAPAIEELVAARAYSVAGPNVNIVSFSATQPPALSANMLDALGVPRLRARQVAALPEEIHAGLKGAARNNAIKAALLHGLPPESLVMAQPFIDDHVEQLYQIPPALTNWLNDKANLPEFVPPKALPTRYGEYASGDIFAGAAADLPLPCVVKVSSSSSGDGVHLCRTAADIKKAVKAVRGMQATVIAEQYIEAGANYAVHFGIPHDPAKGIDIIGANEQLTTPGGSFIGGMISSSRIPPQLARAVQLLHDTILPAVRGLGWYGVGGIDVLLDHAGNTYFIDGNFRMTGMTAYHLLCSTGQVHAPLLSFQGTFTGKQEELIAALTPLAAPENPDRIMQVIALSGHGDTWRYNAALFFDDLPQLQYRAGLVLASGTRSDALSQVAA